MRGVERQQRRLAGHGDGVDDQSPAVAPDRCQQWSISPGAAAPPPTKIAVGRRQVGQRRRAPRRCARPARARQLLGVGGDARGADRVALDRDRPHAAARPQPLDGDAAGAGADVPEQLAVAGREGRQGDRADLGLGELAVMVEGVVGQAGDDRQRLPPGSATSSTAIRLRSAKRSLAQVGGRALDQPLVRAAQLLQHHGPAGGEAGIREAAADRGRGRAVGGQHQQPPAGLEVPAQRGDGAAVGGHRVHLLERPAETAARLLEGRDMRQDRDL